MGEHIGGCAERGAATMGDHWWLILVGAAIWTPMLIAAYRHLRNPKTNPDACPRCKHECGVDGTHCENVDDDNGWSSSRCRCQNDYHWNYESTAVS